MNNEINPRLLPIELPLRDGLRIYLMRFLSIATFSVVSFVFLAMILFAFFISGSLVSYALLFLYLCSVIVSARIVTFKFFAREDIFARAPLVTQETFVDEENAPGFTKTLPLEMLPRIKVVGVGGGGCNAVDRMIDEGLQGVDFVAVNTDAKALMLSKAPTRVRIGEKITRGLGSGGDPETGRKASEESAEELYEVLRGSDMVFITAGMGGGTGTGAAPIVAKIAKETGSLVIGIVTLPFTFEMKRRMQVAEMGVIQLKEFTDTLIVIRMDSLLQIADKRATLQDTFRLADDVLLQAVQGISELITIPGLINIDFTDMRSIMSAGGASLIGFGRASGPERAKKAAEAATSSSLLDITIDGARNILFNIMGGPSLTLFEVNQAAAVIREAAHPNVNMIFGAVIDPKIGDEIHIVVIATGFESNSDARSIGTQQPLNLHKEIKRDLDSEQDDAIINRTKPRDT